MNSVDLEYAQSYLLDLLRAYGHRPITVKLDSDGEPVEVMAMTFIKRQLSKLGILFPYNEGNKKNMRHMNTSLDNDMLSVIFHEALFAFEEAYVEANCVGKPQAAHFVDSVYNWIDRKRQWIDCTFPQYDDEELNPFPPKEPKLAPGELLPDEAEFTDDDVKRLKKLGYTRIGHVKTMQQLFWDLAFRRHPLGKKMKNAILSITVDEEAANYLNSNYRFFNQFLQGRIEEENANDEGKETIKDKNKEINKLTHDYNVKIKALKTEYQEIVHNQKQELKVHKKISKVLRPLLLSPLGAIQKSYDMTTEKDIGKFLIWFRIWGKRVPDSFVRGLEKYRYQEPGSLDLLKQMIAEHNAKYEVVVDDSEETEDDEQGNVDS